MMENDKLTLGVIAMLTAGVIGLKLYMNNLESKIPVHTINNTKVVSIDKTFMPNDLFTPSLGYNKKVEGEERDIRLNQRTWDYSILEGDTIDLTFRDSIFGWGIEGLTIDDYK